MTSWDKSLRSYIPDCILVSRVSLLLLGCWLGLRMMPIGTVRRILAKIISFGKGAPERDPIYRAKIIWAISKGSGKFLGQGACLPQAIIAQLLLTQDGFPASLEIGVKKSEGGKLLAHAWVLIGEEVVIGGKNVDLLSYTPLFHVNGILS